MESKRKRITMVPGDGVGPELMSSVQNVFSATGVPVDFEEVLARCVYAIVVFFSVPKPRAKVLAGLMEQKSLCR